MTAQRILDGLVRLGMSGLGGFVGLLAGFLVVILIKAVTGSQYITPLSLVIMGVVAGSTSTWMYIYWPKFKEAMK